MLSVTIIVRNFLRIAIIGAGPSGLSAALHLSKMADDHIIDVYEASPHVGGLSRSFYLFDHIVDLGPHRFFTQDKSVMRLWLDLAQGDCHSVTRRTSIFYENQFIAYPITFGNIFKSLPFRTKSKILSSLIHRNKHKNKDGDNFSSTMRYRFGDALYELFFKDYTERLWGVPDEELSASLAYQRIGDFGLFHALSHAVRSYFSAIEDTFFYPTRGCGQIWETAAIFLQKKNVQLNLSCPVKSITRKINDGFEIKSLMGSKHYDQVISTMPISQFMQAYSVCSEKLFKGAQSLIFRSTVLVYVEVSGHSRFQDQWTYVNSKNIETGRITNFSNWNIPNNNNKSTHVLCMEYWCTAGDSFWSTSDKLLAHKALIDLQKLNYSPNQLHRTHVVRIPNTYPVITHKTEQFLKDFSTEMSTHKNIQTIGRSGAFKYNNQDHCMAMGVFAAKNVLGDTQDIWSVNTQKTYLEQNLAGPSLPPG